MKEAKTISGVSAELFSDVAECIKPGRTITAVVGFEHLKHLCVDRPLRKIRKANSIPCGKCEMGIYSELAMLNKKARAFGAMSVHERLACMPSCKTHDRVCRGAIELHNMICMVDKLYPAEVIAKAAAMRTEPNLEKVKE